LNPERRSLMITPVPVIEPEIGRWLWGMEDVRRTMKTRLAEASQAVLDTRLEGAASIGSLLYHVAFIEADWLYEEVLCSPWDPDIKALFPVDCREDNDDLSHVEGESIERHFERLDRVRNAFLSVFREMSLEDWRRPRVLEPYDVTPEWVVYHLIEHEAHHRGQIFSLHGRLLKSLESEK